MKNFKYHSLLIVFFVTGLIVILLAHEKWRQQQGSVLETNKNIILQTLAYATYQDLNGLKNTLELHSIQTIDLWQVTDKFGTVLMFNKPQAAELNTDLQQQTTLSIVIKPETDLWAFGEVKQDNLSVTITFKNIELINPIYLWALLMLLTYFVLYMLNRKSLTNAHERQFNTLDQQRNRLMGSLSGLNKHKSELTDKYNSLKLENNKLNAAITNLNHEQDALAQRIKQQRAGKSLFVADLCHEIKTPLTSLYALLTKVADPQKLKIHGSKITKNKQLLSSFLDDFIELAKSDSGSFSVNKTWCNLSVVAQEAIDIATSHNSNARDMVLTYNTAQLECLTDPLRIKQICINLLTNAMKYGGNFIHLDITVDPARTDNLSQTVRDYGKGIAQDTKEKIFKAFERGCLDENKEYEGIGLGLHIVCNICNALGASINVYDAIPQGSIFEVRMQCQTKNTNEKIAEITGASIAFIGNKSPIRLALSQSCGDGTFIDSFVDEYSFLEHLSLEQPSYDLIVSHGTFNRFSTQVKEVASQSDVKLIELSNPTAFETLPQYEQSNITQLTPDIIRQLIGDLPNQHHYQGNVLLLDDTPSNTLPIRQMAGLDYTILVTDNIHDAMSAAKATSFSLILVDLKLFDGEQGYDFITRCRLFGLNTATTIYAYTASSVNSLLDFCILTGADNILEKPVAQHLTIEQIIKTKRSIAIQVPNFVLPEQLLSLTGETFINDVTHWQREITRFLSRENATGRCIYDEVFSYILTLSTDSDAIQVIDYLLQRLHQFIQSKDKIDSTNIS